jgi:hypothetical protein
MGKAQPPPRSWTRPQEFDYPAVIVSPPPTTVRELRAGGHVMSGSEIDWGRFVSLCYQGGVWGCFGCDGGDWKPAEWPVM